MSCAEKLLSQLKRVSKHGTDRWRAVCPAHESKNNTQSLAIREMPDGTLLITCFAGCGACDVVAAVGLQLRDLFPDRPGGGDDRDKVKPGHWHAIRQAIQTLNEDCLMVAIAASDVANGKPLSLPDARKVMLAGKRIRRAVEACR